jgi:hypothetical protein
VHKDDGDCPWDHGHGDDDDDGEEPPAEEAPVEQPPAEEPPVVTPEPTPPQIVYVDRPVPVYVQVPATCPSCPKPSPGQPATECKQCVSRRTQPIRIIEKRGHRIKAATVRVKLTGKLASGRNVTRTFKGKRVRGRIVVRVRFAGFIGPDVASARISGREQRTNTLIRGVRLYRICKVRDGEQINFVDEIRL